MYFIFSEAETVSFYVPLVLIALCFGAYLSLRASAYFSR
jgi:hypothetical protein